MIVRVGFALIVALLTGCPGERETTPLIGAARNGDVAAIKSLIARGADPGQRGGVNGWPPLMHAVHKNQTAAVATLLEAGADPNERATGGSTALIMAAGYGATDIVRLLLARGADPKIKDRNGDSALSVAISGRADIDNFTLGKCQVATVKVILDAAPDLKANIRLPDRCAE
jgi:ankyrin repeat protein